MTPEKQQILKEMRKSSQGEALRSLLNEALVELGDVTKCDSWEDTLARAHSKRFIEQTFSFLQKPEEKKSRRESYL